MARTKFTQPNRDEFVGLIREGLSNADAAREVGLYEGTVDNWLKRGRKEDSGDYHDFAVSVENARAKAGDREEPGSEEELRIVTWRAAKLGSVAAMKLYWEMVRRKPEDEKAPVDPFEALDGPLDLDAARKRKAAGS